MIDLESRLRALRQVGEPAASPVEIRRRAAVRRRRRHRRWAAASVLLVVVAGIASFAASTRDGGDVVATGPTQTSTASAGPADNRVLGSVHDVTVTVEPQVDLRDGDLVTVSVTGLVNLPGAVILECVGDVSEANAMQSCDTAAVEKPAGPAIVPVSATDEQTVSIARTIHVNRGSNDPNPVREFDCATEPVGCVLAIGPYDLPPRAVLVPLRFDPAPPPSPSGTLDPSTDLQHGQTIAVTARALRPNATFDIQLCDSGPHPNCDAFAGGAATTNRTGELTTTTTARAAIYGQRGRTDCVQDQCAVVITRQSEPLLRLPLTFAPGVLASVATLSIDEPPPYTNRQEVTVRGFGFPPGFDLNGHLGQCPADKDTAVEERCGYELDESVVVDANGEFVTTVRLFDSLTFTGTCVTGAGCILAWVIVHGPIAASVPLSFRQ